MDIRKNKKGWLFAAVVVILLWALIGMILMSSLKSNGGGLAYLLDDTYIHMAMAKNFSQHGVWGVTRYEFSSSSSSLLWTALISFVYKLFGVNDWTPLVLGLLSATALILFLFFYFRDRTPLSGWNLILVCLGFVFAIPLPYLIFSGLEHGLQILLDLLFLISAVGLLTDKDPSQGDGAPRTHHRRLLIFYLLASLVVLVRFEGLFLVAAVVLLLLARRAYSRAALCVVAAGIPVVVYGIISLSQGWYFLPNSIYLKGNRPDLTHLAGLWDFIHSGLRQLIYNIHVFIPILVILFLLFMVKSKSGRIWDERGAVAALIFISTVVMHMLFARSGFFLNYYYQVRYDAYLVALGLFVLFLALFDGLRDIRTWRWPVKVTLIVLLAVVSLPILERGIRASAKVVAATHTTHIYQYQMGMFLDKNYSGKTVVLNDIGAPNFYADIKCFDVLALCSKGVAETILANNYTSGAIHDLAVAADAEIAIINDDLLRGAGGVPDQWVRVARWFISGNVISEENVLSFYVLKEADTRILAKALADFAPEISPGVRQVMEKNR